MPNFMTKMNIGSIMMFVVYPKTIFRQNEKELGDMSMKISFTKKVSNPNKVVV